MPTPLIVAVALGSVLGGFVQGLSGFAFGLVAVGIWAWTIDPTIVGPLVVFGSLVGQVLSFATVRRGLDAGRLLPFIIGGLFGIPLGVALLRVIDPLGFKLAVGVILLVWCPAMLLLRELPRVSGGGRWADGAAGWLGGIMGGLGGLTGPPPTLWCALRGWGRDEQRAVFQNYNLVMQAVTIAVYVATGTITTETAWLFAIVAPAMLVPTLIGARLYRRFSDAGFQRLVLLLLTASGALLTVSAVSGLIR
jgi:uncharacterized membrane protein YfcA